MTRVCETCVASPTWWVNASPNSAALGTCDFCSASGVRTHLSSAWSDSMLNLLGLYEPAEAGGTPIGDLVQRDWAIFRDPPPGLVGQFLAELAGDTGFTAQTLARRRTGDGDPLEKWRDFSREIREENRYFLSRVPDRDALGAVFDQCTAKIAQETLLYRGRIETGTTRLRANEMGAPPRHLATGGRANPPGIPYLYLAHSVETCISESRAGTYSRIAVATFKLSRPVEVLDLSDAPALDFFTGDPALSLPLHDYMRELREQLRQPVLPTDAPVDYIPTQYVCEFAKSRGLDGVQYGSSLHPGGRNVVLFRPELAAPAGRLRRFRVEPQRIVYSDVT